MTRTIAMLFAGAAALAVSGCELVQPQQQQVTPVVRAAPAPVQAAPRRAAPVRVSSPAPVSTPTPAPQPAATAVTYRCANPDLSLPDPCDPTSRFGAGGGGGGLAGGGGGCSGWSC
jgi:hypothetical protein